jgi:type IV secretion system protein TrbE
MRAVKERTKRVKPEMPDLLPWAFMPTPEIVCNKDGALMSCIGFRGVDLDSATLTQLQANAARINNILRRFPGGWALYIEAQRREVRHYPEAQWPNAIGRVIATERRAQFQQPGTHFESQYFLSPLWLPPADKLRRLEQLIFTANEDDAPTTAADEALRYFQEQGRRCVDLLRDAMASAALLAGDDVWTYLHSTVDPEWQRVKVSDCTMYLDFQLGTLPFHHGIAPLLGKYYLKTVTLRSFPNESYPGLLDALNHLELPYRFVSRWLPMDKPDAEAQFNSQRRKWWHGRRSIMQHLSGRFMGTPDDQFLDNMESISKTEGIEAALTNLAENTVSYGHLTTTVTVWDTDERHASEKQLAVEQAIKAQGFTVYDEWLNATEAWRGSIPGNCGVNPRRPILNSLNLAHLMPITAVWGGPAWDTHLNAPPLVIAKTSGQTPFRVVLHERGVGHTMIVGPTGTGKTMLVRFLAQQFQQYPRAQAFIFDKKQGLRGITAAVSGTHYILGGESGALAFQPLRPCDDAGQRRWCAEWVEGVVGDQHLTITPALRAEIWQALCNLGTAPPEQRTITGLSSLVQITELRQALEPYTLRGAYGQCLDAAEDTLRLSDWCCFEMDALFNLPGLVAPTLSYLFHTLAGRFDGRPTFLLMDEAWRYLAHPLFLLMIEEWLRELRKANVNVVFSTQSLIELLDSPIANILLASCPIRIFLPDDRALEPEVAKAYQRVNLNSRQLELLSMATPQRDYYYMSREGARMFELGLGPIARAACGMDSKEELAVLEQWRITPPQESIAAAILRYKGLEAAADAVERMTV